MSDILTFITGNPNKVAEAVSIFGENFPFKVIYKDIDLLEYQGEIGDICILKCKEAAKHVKGPIIIEDTSLCFNALNGLPGPYIKWFLTKLGPEGLYRLLAGWEDKTAYAVCTFAFMKDENSTVELFYGRTDGEIVKPRGTRGFGWDCCFQASGMRKTYAEISVDEKNSLSHRCKALQLLKKFLIAQNM